MVKLGGIEEVDLVLPIKCRQRAFVPLSANMRFSSILFDNVRFKTSHRFDWFFRPFYVILMKFTLFFIIYPH